MTYPATTYAEGVELTITSGNQLHEIINGDATEEINTESGMVPSVRKALADSMLFKPAIAWAEGSVESDPFQTRLYGEGIYWAPAASNETPISMGTNPNIDGNWFLAPVTGGETISRNTNLLSNHNFIIKSPDDITHPSVTPTDYVSGTQVFSGVFVGDDIVGLTYVDGRVSWTSGTLYFSVPNSGALEYVDQTEFVASVADFDGKPRTRGVSFALVGDEYRVTVGVDALEDESANETLLGSVKFEQGSVATGHFVGGVSAFNLTDYTKLVFIGVHDMIAGIPIEAMEGQNVSTGNSDWKIIPNQPKAGVQLDNGLWAMPLNGVHIDDFGAFSYAEDFTVAPVGFISSTNATNEALDTGATVIASNGTYIFDDELLCFTAAQRVRGQGGGELQVNFGKKENVSYSTRFFWTGSPTKYTKTRRQPRLLASDPVDAPTAVGFNVENDFVHIDGIFVDLECNYTDSSPSNLGADYDVGVFVGTRLGFKLTDSPIRGYWRQGSFILDVTRLGEDFQFSTPGGKAYPSGDVLNGSDRAFLERVTASGGLKGCFISGAIETGTGQYYDAVADALLTDSRGGFGASDLDAKQCYFTGRDHHSGWRAYDAPIDGGSGTLNPNLVDTDALSAPLVIDGRRGSVSQPRIRRQRYVNCRFVTIEAARIFVDRGHEILFDFPQTESLSGSVFDTSGAPVDQFDYATVSFKDIACKGTDWNGAGTGADRISFLRSNGTPRTNYFQDIVDNTETNLVGSNFIQEQDRQLQFLFNAGTPVFTTNKLEFTQIGGQSMVSIALAYSALDTADSSVFTLGVASGQTLLVGDNGTLNVDRNKSSGLNYSTGDVFTLTANDVSTNTRFELRKNGELVTYNSGDVNASGILVVSGLTAESGF